MLQAALLMACIYLSFPGISFGTGLDSGIWPSCAFSPRDGIWCLGLGAKPATQGGCPFVPHHAWNYPWDHPNNLDFKFVAGHNYAARAGNCNRIPRNSPRCNCREEVGCSCMSLPVSHCGFQGFQKPLTMTGPLQREGYHSVFIGQPSLESEANIDISAMNDNN